MSINFLLEKVSQVQIDVNVEDILEKLNDRYRWPFRYHGGQASVEVIMENGSKADVLFSMNDGYLIPKSVHEYYNEGYTIILSRVQTLHKDIQNLAMLVNNFCNREVNINAYFGTGAKSISFPPHCHEYGVVIKNVKGVSNWLINDNRYILKDQNAIYLEPFVDHAVTKIIEPKFSLTCNLVGDGYV